MPLTSGAKYARRIAERLREAKFSYNQLMPGGLIVSELRALAREYLNLTDDYEDRYRRAKVEALNEVIQELNNYYDELDSGKDGWHDPGYGSGTLAAIGLAERVRLRYLKEGGE